MAWQNLRHAIDEWNNANAIGAGFSFDLVTTSDPSATVDERFCDVVQRKVVALIVDEVETIESLYLLYSMCERFRMPCVLTNGRFLPNGKKLRDSFKGLDHEFVTNIGLSKGAIGRAASELVIIFNI